jgi:hypothetical protein
MKMTTADNRKTIAGRSTTGIISNICNQNVQRCGTKISGRIITIFLYREFYLWFI